MTNPVDAALAAAAQKQQANSVATATSAPASVSAYQPQARRSALAAAAADTSLGVGGYISFKPTGFVIGTATKLASIRLRAKVSEWGATAEAGAFNCGSPPKYYRTYDGVTEKSTGRPWAEVFSQMQTQFGDLRPCTSYDLVMELVEETGGLKAGTRLGYSTTYTGNAKVVAFLVAISAADAIDAVIEFDFIHETVTNKAGQEYATFQFGDFVVVA